MNDLFNNESEVDCIRQIIVSKNWIALKKKNHPDKFA